MNKVERLFLKVKDLREDLDSITFEECKKFYKEEKVFNTEMEAIRLDLNYVYHGLEAMVHCIQGEYNCFGCGKWFTPPSVDPNGDYMCTECEKDLGSPRTSTLHSKCG